MSNFLNDVNNFLAMMLRSTKAEVMLRPMQAMKLMYLWMILFDEDVHLVDLEDGIVLLYDDVAL